MQGNKYLRVVVPIDNTETRSVRQKRQQYLLDNWDDMATIEEVRSLLSENKQLSIINPTSYHGRPDESAYLFTKTFDQYCDYNNIQGEKQLKLFGILLKGLAANWYESLTAAQKPDYTTVKTLFQSHFQGTNSNFLNQQKLENVKYDPNTPIELYIEQVIQLGNNMALGDNDKKQALLRGLPASTKASVIAHGPSTLMETIQRLMLINQGDQLKREEQQQHSRSMEMATLTAAVANIEKIVTRPPGYSHRQNRTPGYGAGGNHRTTQRPPWPAPGIRQPPPRRCFTCGQNGHFSRNCYNRRDNSFNTGQHFNAPLQRQPNPYHQNNYDSRSAQWTPRPRQQTPRPPHYAENF